MITKLVLQVNRVMFGNNSDTNGEESTLQTGERTRSLARRPVLSAVGAAAFGAGLSVTATRGAAQEQQQFDFGQTVVDSCSETIIVSVTNQDEEQSQTNAIEGPDADQFNILTGTTIPPGETQNVIILFVPTSEGPKQATIVGSVGGTPVSEAALSGVGITLADASPSETANFLEQPVDSQSTISVTGTYPESFPEAIEITGSQTAGQTPEAFEVSNVSVGQVVQPGGTFEFDISFVPTSSGPKSTNLVIESQSLQSGFPYCALVRAQGLAVESGEDPVAEVFDLNEEALQLINEALEQVILVINSQGGSVAEARELAVQARQLIEQMLSILDDLTGDDSPLTGERLQIMRDVAQLAEQMLDLTNQAIEVADQILGTTSQSAGLLPTPSIVSASNLFFSLSGGAVRQEQDSEAELVRLLEEVLVRAEEIDELLEPLVSEEPQPDPSCPDGLDVSFDFQNGEWVAVSGDAEGLSVEGNETQATVRAAFPFTIDYTLESEDLDITAELNEETGEYCAAIGDCSRSICSFRVHCSENDGGRPPAQGGT